MGIDNTKMVKIITKKSLALILILFFIASIYCEENNEYLYKNTLAPESNIKTNLSQLIKFFNLFSKLPSVKRFALLKHNKNFAQILKFLINNSQKVNLSKLKSFLIEEQLFKAHFKNQQDFESYQWIGGVGDLVLGRKKGEFKLISLSYKGRDYGLSEKVVTMNAMELSNDTNFQKLIEEIYKKDIIKKYVANLKNTYIDPIEFFEKYCSFMKEVSFGDYYLELLQNAFISSFDTPKEALAVIEKALKQTKVQMVQSHALNMIGSLSSEQLAKSLSGNFVNMLNQYFLKNDNTSFKFKKEILSVLSKLGNKQAMEILSFYGDQYFQTETNYDLSLLAIKLLGKKGWNNSQKWLYNILTSKKNIFKFAPGITELYQEIVNSIEKVAESDLNYSNHLLKKGNKTTKQLLKNIVFNLDGDYPDAARIAAIKIFVSKKDSSIFNDLIQLFDNPSITFDDEIIEAIAAFQIEKSTKFLEMVILDTSKTLNGRITAVNELIKTNPTEKQLKKIHSKFASDATSNEVFSLESDDDKIEESIKKALDTLKNSQSVSSEVSTIHGLSSEMESPESSSKLIDADAVHRIQEQINDNIDESVFKGIVLNLVEIGLNGTPEAKTKSLEVLIGMVNFDQRKHQNFIIDQIKEMGMLPAALKVMMEKKVLADWKNYGILISDVIMGYLVSKNKKNYVQIVRQLSPEIKKINFDSVTWENLANMSNFSKTISLTSSLFDESNKNNSLLENAVDQIFSHIMEIEDKLQTRVTAGEEYEPVIKEFISDEVYNALIPGNDTNEVITLPSKTYLLQQIFSRNIPSNRKAGVHRTFVRVTDLLDAKLINVLSQLYSHGMINDKTLIADQGVGYADKDLENFRNWKIRYKDPKTKVGTVNLMEFTAWQTHMSCGLMQYLLTYADLFPLKWHELRSDLLDLLNLYGVDLYEYDSPKDIPTGIDEKVQSTGRLEVFEESTHALENGQTFKVAKYQNVLANTLSGDDEPVMRKIINNRNIIEKISDVIIEVTESKLQSSKEMKKTQAFPVLKEFYLSVFRADYEEDFEKIDILKLEAIEAEAQKNTDLANNLRQETIILEKKLYQKKLELEQKAARAALNKIKNVFSDYRKSSNFQNSNKILGDNA